MFVSLRESGDLFVCKMNSQDREFPLEIFIEHHKSRHAISYTIQHSGCFHNGQESIAGSNQENLPQVGKLTGLQLRGLASLDQLEAMMQIRLAPLIKRMAESNANDLAIWLRTELDDPGHESQDLLKAITAMALFSYRELVDRGLLPPNKPTQEPNDGDDYPDSNDND
jgi:hypothetical protein